MPQLYQRPSGLLVPKAAAGRVDRPVMDELAPISGGLDITRPLIDSLPLLPPQDPILDARTDADALDIYLQVLDHWQVASLLQQRRLAVVATEWEVLPGGTKRRDKQAQELIEAVLNHLRWDAITSGMHYGVFFGRAAAELLWAKDGAHVIPEQIRVRDPRRFAWRPDGTMVLLTEVHRTDGEPIPARKFWAYQTAGWHDDDPYGMGIAHWCYWPVQFARGVAKLWLLRLDKSASPTALGHFPGTASPAERTRLLRALEAIRSHSSIILPEGMSAELLEASRGSEDYLQAAEYFDRAISKVIAGHSAAADATPGRLGGEDTAGDVTADIVRADADLLCASANLTWVRWVIDWSLPGAAYPRIWRRTQAEEDLTSRATRERSLFDMGYRPTLRQIEETYDGEWEDVGAADASVGDADRGDDTDTDTDRDPDAAADLAAADILDAQDQIDAAAGADPGYQAAMEALVAPILAALDDGLTPEEILARLDEWYPLLNDDALLGILERGIAAAEALGRLEVQEEQETP